MRNFAHGSQAERGKMETKTATETAMPLLHYFATLNVEWKLMLPIKQGFFSKTLMTNSKTIFLKVTLNSCADDFKEEVFTHLEHLLLSSIEWKYRYSEKNPPKNPSGTQFFFQYYWT